MSIFLDFIWKYTLIERSANFNERRISNLAYKAPSYQKQRPHKRVLIQLSIRGLSKSIFLHDILY